MRLKTHNPSPIITKLTKIHHHPSIPSSCHHHHTATSTMMIAGGVSIRSLGFLLIFQWLCVFSQAFVIHHSSIYASSSRRLIVLPVSSTDDENHVPSSSSSALLQAIKTMPLLSDAGRAFHGRGGSFPDCEHLTLDWLGPVWLLTSFIELSDDELTEIGDALNVRWAELVAPSSSEQSLNWVYQCRADGAKTFTKLMAGEVPDPHLITENNLQYVVKVLHGKNHGIFLDMRHGRAWVQEHAKDQIILNLFAYTCAFSVAALQDWTTEPSAKSIRRRGGSFFRTRYFQNMGQDSKIRSLRNHRGGSSHLSKGELCGQEGLHQDSTSTSVLFRTGRLGTVVFKCTRAGYGVSQRPSCRSGTGT
jgi:hypothetical protein